MAFKFEGLNVWRASMDYIDVIYGIASSLPDDERFNLSSQIRRAATSIALNIAEGSTSQTDSEQRRFLGFAIRSLVETVACLQIIRRREFAVHPDRLAHAYSAAEILMRQLQAFRGALTGRGPSIREADDEYYARDGGDQA